MKVSILLARAIAREGATLRSGQRPVAFDVVAEACAA